VGEEMVLGVPGPLAIRAVKRNRSFQLPESLGLFVEQRLAANSIERAPLTQRRKCGSPGGLCPRHGKGALGIVVGYPAPLTGHVADSLVPLGQSQFGEDHRLKSPTL
jgi:hypothetical protein